MRINHLEVKSDEYDSVNRKELLEEIERLDCENAYLKKLDALLQEKEKAKIILGLRQKHTLKILLSVSEIHKSTYYYIVNSFNNPDKYSTQKALIKDIFDTHKGLYGYRRVTLELWNRRVEINHKTVLKLMRELGLKSKLHCRKYRTYIIETSLVTLCLNALILT